MNPTMNPTVSDIRVHLARLGASGPPRARKSELLELLEEKLDEGAMRAATGRDIFRFNREWHTEIGTSGGGMRTEPKRVESKIREGSEAPPRFRGMSETLAMNKTADDGGRVTQQMREMRAALVSLLPPPTVWRGELHVTESNRLVSHEQRNGGGDTFAIVPFARSMASYRQGDAIDKHTLDGFVLDRHYGDLYAVLMVPPISSARGSRDARTRRVSSVT